MKARRRRVQQQPVKPVDRISLADDRELRLIRGLWFEVQLAPLPAPDYRPCREVQRRPLKPYDRRSRIVDVEVTVRRLATPPVRDVVTAAMIEAGPAIDEWAA